MKRAFPLHALRDIFRPGDYTTTGVSVKTLTPATIFYLTFMFLEEVAKYNCPNTNLSVPKSYN